MTGSTMKRHIQVTFVQNENVEFRTMYVYTETYMNIKLLLNKEPCHAFIVKQGEVNMKVWREERKQVN